MDKYCLGIDVDKKSLKVCLALDNLSEIKVKGSRTFTNTLKGFTSLLDWVNKKCKSSFSAVLEATGVYHEELSYFLNSKQVKVHIVLPSLSKHYMRSLGHRSKTDQLDAKGLAYMGCQRHLNVWTAPSKSMVELRSLTRQVEALQQQRTIVKNQFEALSHAHTVHKAVLKSNKAILSSLEKQIDKLKKLIQETVEQDAVLSEKYELFSTLKGIGIMNFAVVVSETNGFELFYNQKQLTSYAGYDVIENQSGQRSGRTRMSKKGNSHIRRILHMAAWSAVTHQVAPFYQLYQRVFDRTRIKSKAYVAVQRKLLMMMYTLWKKNKMFDPDFNYEQKQVPSKKESSGKQICNTNSKKTVTLKKVTALDRLSSNQIAESLLFEQQI